MRKLMMGIDERLDMERQYRNQESNQARYAGRLKFACCRRCEREDGMKSVHHETLAEMPSSTLNWIRSQKFGWYREPDTDEYLFYPCPTCNPDRIIPDGFIFTCDIQAWLDRDPIQPNYAALAAEPEAATAGQDSHESAGI